MQRKYSFRSFISTAVLCLLSACSSGPRSFAIRGEGDPVLNPDINGKSLSVVVRLYQLKDAREFSKLTFDMLASGRSESEILGPALLDKTDVVIVPGGNYEATEKLLDETRFVGIVAFFREPDAYYWRQLVEVGSISTQNGTIGRPTALTFKVQDCYVSLAGVKPVALPGIPNNDRPDCSASRRPGDRRTSRALAPASRQTPSSTTPHAGLNDANRQR